MKSISIKDFMNPKREGAKAFTEQWNKFVPSQYGTSYSTGFDVGMLK